MCLWNWSILKYKICILLWQAFAICHWGGWFASVSQTLLIGVLRTLVSDGTKPTVLEVLVCVSELAILLRGNKSKTVYRIRRTLGLLFLGMYLCGIHVLFIKAVFFVDCSQLFFKPQYLADKLYFLNFYCVSFCFSLTYVWLFLLIFLHQISPVLFLSNSRFSHTGSLADSSCQVFT